MIDVATSQSFQKIDVKLNNFKNKFNIFSKN